MAATCLPSLVFGNSPDSRTFCQRPRLPTGETNHMRLSRSLAVLAVAGAIALGGPMTRHLDFAPSTALARESQAVPGVFNSSLTPTVTAKSPAVDATGVSVNSAVTATFNRAMDPATVNTSTFRLREVGAGSDVPATVTYSGFTATLTPTQALSVNKTYQVTVAGSMAGADGTRLGSDVTWSFTTQPFLSFTDTSAADFGRELQLAQRHNGLTPDSMVLSETNGESGKTDGTAAAHHDGSVLPMEGKSRYQFLVRNQAVVRRFG